jgi:ribonuclease HIII
MAVTNYVKQITAEQATALRGFLERGNWTLDEIPYACYRARKGKTTCVAYTSGKLVVQGRGTEELVQFVIEPEILKEARLGYENVYLQVEHPEMFEPHAGIDESGKGDFFGPLVIACCYTDAATGRLLLDLGVQDSKNIKSDRRMAGLAANIREITKGRAAVVPIGNAAYNRLYAKLRNVNRLLAWGHARALENLLDKVPGCPRALSDQFGPKSRVQRALLGRGRQVCLEQRPKAEADIAVAAASILARHEFVTRMDRLSDELGVRLPKGASPAVFQTAVDLVKAKGPDILPTIAKMHFQTSAKVLAAAGFPVAPPPAEPEPGDDDDAA